MIFFPLPTRRISLHSMPASVNNLADSSEKLLTYISNDVMADYDKFVKTTEDYLSDADKIENMMVELNNGAKESMALSDEINNQLSDIQVRQTGRIWKLLRWQMP